MFVPLFGYVSGVSYRTSYDASSLKIISDSIVLFIHPFGYSQQNRELKQTVTLTWHCDSFNGENMFCSTTWRHWQNVALLGFD